MLMFLGELVLLSALDLTFVQLAVNRPQETSPTTPALECCVATAVSSTPPPPQGTNRGLMTEPMILTSLVDAIVSRSKNEGTESTGFYLKFGAGVPGAGWIAVGPGYRHLFDDRLMVDVNTSVSWRRYMGARARFEVRPFANPDVGIGAQVLGQDWTQVKYFGLGPDSREEDKSVYRLRATDVAAYATISPGHVVTIGARAGILSRPRITRASGWNRGDYPDTQSLFGEVEAPGLSAQPRFWHADIVLSADTLDHPGHPTRGLLLELSASNYDDRDFDKHTFRRYEALAIAAIPLAGNKWTLNARGTVIASETSGTNEVPFYMLPSLGQNMVRGFDTGRFHDRNLLAINVESRWALFQHMDVAVFSDFGKVSPTFDGLELRGLKSSYGAGLRFHTGADTFLRLDAAKAKGEGWRVVLKLHEALRASKLLRWNSVVPVVR